jgi:hypothetical protein
VPQGGYNAVARSWVLTALASTHFHMRNSKILLTLVIGLALAAGGVWLYAQSKPFASSIAVQNSESPRTASQSGVSTSRTAALPSSAPSFGTAAAFPSVLIANIPTMVTVTVPIPDSSLIPNSVNFLQLGSTGTQPILLGHLHDDGLNGDAAAGDGIYTLEVTFTQPAGQFAVVVSAGFRGHLERLFSNQINIAVTPTGSRPLPPDPGAAGMAPLGGIDSDGDGIRDDVQRYIALTYPSSAKMQAALTQVAAAYLPAIIDNNNPTLAAADLQAANYAIDCLSFATPPSGSPDQILTQLEGQILNTQPRITAFLNAQNALPSTSFDMLPSLQARKARCLVNPDTLPN